MKGKNEQAVSLGRRGGQKTRDKHGVEHYKRIAKLAHASRAKKQLDKKTAGNAKLTDKNGIAGTSLKSESEGLDVLLN